MKDQAIVCKHCGRDLALPKPLIEENAELKRQVEELRARNTQLERFAPRHESGRAGASPGETSRGTFGSGFVARYVILPVLLLLIAHYLIIISLDLRPLVLRLLSVALPLPFGFALFWESRRGFVVPIFVGFAVGVLAVAGMLAVVGYVDNVAVLPADGRDWREAGEYAVSIMLAMITGYILGRFAARDASDPLHVAASAMVTLIGPAGAEKTLKGRIEFTQQVFTALVATATTLGSIYAGLKSVLQ